MGERVKIPTTLSASWRVSDSRGIDALTAPKYAPILSPEQIACANEAFAKNAVSLGLDALGALGPALGAAGLIFQTAVGITYVADSASSANKTTTGVIGLGSTSLVFTSKRFRGLLDHRPHRPVTQELAFDPAALPDGPQQPTLGDSGSRSPGVDALLDPDRNGNRPDASSLSFQIGQDPPSLPLLNSSSHRVRPTPSCEVHTPPGETGSSTGQLAGASSPGRELRVGELRSSIASPAICRLSSLA